MISYKRAANVPDATIAAARAAGHGVNQVKSARRGTVQDIREFSRFDLLQLFSALLQLFECLHDGLCHAPVSFLGSADDGELITSGDALVTVLIVEADAQETRR